MSLSDFLQDIEEIKQRAKEQKDENSVDDSGTAETPTEEPHGESEDTEFTGTQTTTDGEIESQPVEESEPLAEDTQSSGGLKTKEEWDKLVKFDPDVGMYLNFQSEEDVQGMADVADINLRHLRTEGFGTSHLYSLFRWGKHKIDSLFEKDTEPFNLEEAFKRDAIPDKDKCLYTGVNTASDYEYIKSGIEQERTDLQILRNAPFASTLLANTVEFVASIPIFKGIDVALNRLWKVGNLADKATRVGNWERLFGFLKPEYAEDMFKAAGTGAVYGVAQYLSKYDVSGKEAFYQGLSWAFFDGAFRTGGRYLADSVKKKMLTELTEDMSAKDPDELVMNRMKEHYDEFIKLDEEAPTTEVPTNAPKVNKLTKAAMTKGITATHPYMLVFLKSKLAQMLAYALFKFNPKIFPAAAWNEETGMFAMPSMESSCRFYKAETTSEFVQITKNLAEYNSAVKEATGMSSRELFNRIYINRGESAGVVPVDTPFLKEITKDVRLMMRRYNDLHLFEKKVMGYAHKIEPTFLPADLAGENFSVEKIVERTQQGHLGSEPGYFPLWWDRKALSKDPESAKKLIGQALAYQKALSIGEKVSAEDIEAYMKSDDFLNSVEIQYNDAMGLIKIPSSEKGGQVLRRVIRIDPSVILPFLKKDVLDSMYNFFIETQGRLAFEDAIHRCGFKDFATLRDGVAKEYLGMLVGKDTEEAIAIQKEAKKADWLLRQSQYIALYRYTPFEEAQGLFKENPEIIKAIENARSLMMAAWLGKTVLSSLCDVKGMCANYGGKDTFTEIGHTMAGAFDNAYRHLKGLPKSEREQILNSLITGIEENSYFSSSKFNPIQKDEMFFSPSGIAEKNWFKEIGEMTFVASGQRAFDNFLRKIATNLILNKMLKDPKKATEVAEGIRIGKFNKRLNIEILEEIDRLVTKPGLTDVPKWAYTPWGRFFFMLQSWVFSNTANYVYPLINGGFSRRYAAESLITMVSLKMIETYAKGIVSGRPYDFKNEEDQKRFFNNAVNQGLADVVGASEIYWNGLRTLFTHAGTLRSPVYALADLSPLTGWTGDAAIFISNLMRPLLGLDRPNLQMAKKGLRSLPGATVPGIELLLDEVAQAWSGESPKQKTGGRNSSGSTSKRGARNYKGKR